MALRFRLTHKSRHRQLTSKKHEKKKNSLSLSFSFTRSSVSDSRSLSLSLVAPKSDAERVRTREKEPLHVRNSNNNGDNVGNDDDCKFASVINRRQLHEYGQAQTRARVEMAASLIIRVGCREEPFWRLGSARHDDAPPASYCSPSSHRLSLRATRGRRLSLSCLPLSLRLSLPHEEYIPTV